MFFCGYVSSDVPDKKCSTLNRLTAKLRLESSRVVIAQLGVLLVFTYNSHKISDNRQVDISCGFKVWEMTLQPPYLKC